MISVLRTYSVSTVCRRCINSGFFETFREAKMLDKMIKKSLSKRTKEFIGPKRVRKEFLLSAYENEGRNRKTAALNKFYMQQLIEMINFGGFSSQLKELGVECTKVRISSCRSSINVYWISKKKDVSQAAIAELLEKVKKELQEQMGFLRAMRKVPFITFVKDLKLERICHVEKLFEVADIGEKSEAIHPEEDIKKRLDKEFQLLKESRSKMRDNVLGLDHTKIKEKIMEDIRKFEAIKINNDEVSSTENEHPKNLIKFSMKFFDKFYKRKMYLDKKFREREYDDAVVSFDESYDPEKESDKYWQSINDMVNASTTEMEDDEKLYDNDCLDDHYEENVDDCIKNNSYCKEVGKKEKLEAQENKVH